MFIAIIIRIAVIRCILLTYRLKTIADVFVCHLTAMGSVDKDYQCPWCGR